MSVFNRLSPKIRQIDAAIFYVLAALFGLIIIFWGCIEIIGDMTKGNTHHLDTWLLSTLRQPNDLENPIGPPWLLIAARDITALGGHTVLTLITLLAAGYCLILHRYAMILLILTASLGGMALNSLLKWSFARPRPDIVPHLVEVSTLSFPSGHAMLSAAIYLSLGVIMAQLTTGYRTRLYILTVAMLLTAMVGISRIYLGVHYPTDVLAGWTAGLAWALFCWLAIIHLRHRVTIT